MGVAPLLCRGVFFAPASNNLIFETSRDCRDTWTVMEIGSRKPKWDSCSSHASCFHMLYTHIIIMTYICTMCYWTSLVRTSQCVHSVWYLCVGHSITMSHLKTCRDRIDRGREQFHAGYVATTCCRVKRNSSISICCIRILRALHMSVVQVHLLDWPNCAYIDV